ncbi:MAG: phosphatidylserine decarboxylase [Burkholderiales bacterium]|nr:phosphatidylserine decarboxylase [Burkholderiales bacterium]
MSNWPHPIIAREGWPFLALGVIVSGVITYFFGWWSLPFWLVTLFILQFFRDPPREVPQGEGLVLCPADGRVLLVGVTKDPYRNVDALKVSVFMNVFNVHSNRSPVDAVVKDVVYAKGLFVNASFDKASSDNERNALILRMDSGTEISCVQVAGLIARRILCYVKPGERLARGQRYGFIRFGSRVDVYLPTDAKPRVAIGDKVSATTTILAELPGR